LELLRLEQRLSSWAVKTILGGILSGEKGPTCRLAHGNQTRISVLDLIHLGERLAVHQLVLTLFLRSLERAWDQTLEGGSNATMVLVFMLRISFLDYGPWHKRSGVVSGTRGREDLFELGNQKFVALVHKLRPQAPSNCRSTSVWNRPWRSACGAGDLRTVSSLLIFSGSAAHLQGSTACVAEGARQRFGGCRRGSGRSRCSAAVLLDLFLKLRVREGVQRSRQARRTGANIRSGWQQRPTRLLCFDRC